MKDVSLKPTVKYGGSSIMVWVRLTANGVGDLVRIDGIKNAEKYWQILIRHAFPSGQRLIGNSFIFLQDNYPKHNEFKVKSYLK